MTFAQLISSIQSQLGLMTWPLTALSFILLMLLIERTIFFLLNASVGSINIQKQIKALNIDNTQTVLDKGEALSRQRSLTNKGVGLLLRHHQTEKAQREEIAVIWLQEQRARFFAGLKLMNIIGVISPLVGLLGTVLGLMEMFQGIGKSTGSVTPAVLADGLGLAMSTTAAGLMLALPAIACSQLFQLYAERRLNKAEHVMNHCNLIISGHDAEHKERDHNIDGHRTVALEAGR
ncbi:MotA/TolQ/ExbB proton channel family protein [Veronia pacifica]|uniref:MotA/TolQ/ExbB proton channel family protein n=1 Tax=Veronia pacifica TaxID=1080227 RepID=UPI000ABD31B1|nr:MotA/TolQ/ExbB proton channel family protein [Veronia pacifica]